MLLLTTFMWHPGMKFMLPMSMMSMLTLMIKMIILMMVIIITMVAIAGPGSLKGSGPRIRGS